MELVGAGEHDAPLLVDEFGPAVVHVGGGVIADARVAVVVVVPPEESPAEAVGVLERAEPVGEVGPVLERSVLAF